MIIKLLRLLLRRGADVLLDPGVELRLELGVGDGDGRRRGLPPGVVGGGVPLEREAGGRAGGDGGEVVQVGVDVEAEGRGVAPERGDAVADLDVADGVRRGGGGAVRQPVLGGRVRVAEDDGRQAGHGVVEVRHAVLVAGLVGHEGREGRVAHARAAEVDDVDRVPLLPRVRRAQRAHGRAERVPREHDLVRRVRRLGGLHGRQHGAGDLRPRLGETRVHLAARGEAAAALLDELEAGFPIMLVVLRVLGAAAAAARKETYSVSQLRIECDPLMDTTITWFFASVDRNPWISVVKPLFQCKFFVAQSARGYSESNIRESGCDLRASSGNIGAGAGRAGHDGPNGVATVAVGCTGVLCVEVEAGQLGSRDSSCYWFGVSSPELWHSSKEASSHIPRSLICTSRTPRGEPAAVRAKLETSDQPNGFILG